MEKIYKKKYIFQLTVTCYVVRVHFLFHYCVHEVHMCTQ